MIAREDAHGIAWLRSIPRQSQGALRELTRSRFIMKRGQGISRFDLTWRHHLWNGQYVDLPLGVGCVDVANRRVRRAEVDAHDETTRFLRHRLRLLRLRYLLSILTDAELQLPALVRHRIHAP